MLTEANMMHGMDYNRQDVCGWLMSEKLNGCRAFWDGAIMWSRGGGVIVLPYAIRVGLPDVPLDGEIHAGRGGFEVARQGVQYGRWTPECQFSAFDAPAAAGDFRLRYGFIAHLLDPSGPVNFIKHLECQGILSAVELMRSIQADGGEGVVLRNPVNSYKPGRSADILKLKFWGLEC
jgi:DNA ligase-1